MPAKNNGGGEFFCGGQLVSILKGGKDCLGIKLMFSSQYKKYWGEIRPRNNIH
jgi:hypothetical protein